MRKYLKILIIFLTLCLMVGIFSIGTVNAKEIQGVRKVLIMPKGQIERGIEISEKLGVPEVADGIPPALEGKIAEDMLPYVYEEVIYKDEPSQLPQETQKALEKLGADIAEYYATSDSSIEAGDLVSIIDKTEENKGLEFTDKKFFIGKSTQPNDPQLIGVVSDSSAVIINSGEASNNEAETILRPLTLVGRIPVKVSTENGPIVVGDYLTSSSIPGVAMRANMPGRVVGIALESFGTSNDQVSNLNNQNGKIMVFVNLSWYAGELTSDGRMKVKSKLINSNSALTNNTVDISNSALPDFNDVVQNASNYLEGFFNAARNIITFAVDTVTGLPKMIVNGILEAKNDIVTHGVFKGIVMVPKDIFSSVFNQMHSIFASHSIEIQGNVAEASSVEVANSDEQNYNFQTYSLQSTRDEVSVTGSGVLVNCQQVSPAITEYLDIQKVCQEDNSESVAAVMFDPSFTAMVQKGITNPSQQPKIRVITSATSPITGNLYVSDKSLKGFVVRELNSQNVGATFDWIVIVQYPNIGEVINLNEINGSGTVPQNTPTPTPTPSTEPSPQPSPEATAGSAEPSASPSPSPSISPSPSPEPSPTVEFSPTPTPTPTTEITTPSVDTATPATDGITQ